MCSSDLPWDCRVQPARNWRRSKSRDRERRRSKRRACSTERALRKFHRLARKAEDVDVTVRFGRSGRRERYPATLRVYEERRGYSARLELRDVFVQIWDKSAARLPRRDRRRLRRVHDLST